MAQPGWTVCENQWNLGHSWELGRPNMATISHQLFRGKHAIASYVFCWVSTLIFADVPVPSCTTVWNLNLHLYNYCETFLVLQVQYHPCIHALLDVKVMNTSFPFFEITGYPRQHKWLVDLRKGSHPKIISFLAHISFWIHIVEFWESLLKWLPPVCYRICSFSRNYSIYDFFLS